VSQGASRKNVDDKHHLGEGVDALGIVDGVGK
jgi:hypothetical protein